MELVVGRRELVVDRRELGLHRPELGLRRTGQERRMGPGVQRDLDIRVHRFCLAVRLDRRGQRVLLVLGRQGNQEYQVYLVGQQGRRDRPVLLVLGRRGSQERRAYLEVRLGRVHLGSQEFQLGRGDRPYQVCQADQERLFR